MIAAKTETVLAYETLRNRKLTTKGASSRPTPKATLPKLLAAAGFRPSKNTTGIRVLAAVFRAMAPSPNSRHEANTAAYDRLRASSRMHAAAMAKPKTATGP